MGNVTDIGGQGQYLQIIISYFIGPIVTKTGTITTKL